MKTKFHNSKLFRSASTMPSPEDASCRMNPIVETWNELYQTKGIAQIGMYMVDGNGTYETYFSIIEDCGHITHWRWAEGLPYYMGTTA